MADEVWHYGTLSGVFAIFGYVVRHAYKAGKIAQHLIETEERIDRFEIEAIKRLDRIETLLMEGRR